MQPRQLPDELGPAFLVRDALQAGLSRERVRRLDLHRPFHGVRIRGDAEPPDLDVQSSSPYSDEECAEVLRLARVYALRMADHEFFSHRTAAVLWGVPVPRNHDDRLHVSVLAPARAVRTSGVVAHEAQPGLTRVVTHPPTGLRVSSPATTWAMLGAQLLHPYDLVAAGDAFIRVQRMPGPWVREMPPPLATFAQLEAAVRAGRRVGRPALRESLPRLRVAAASRPETWTRLTICDAGLPEPLLDHDVYDESGAFIGCVDLAYPDLKIAIEYEGDHHRTDLVTWNRDLAKHEALQAAGWRVIRVGSAMLFRKPHLLVSLVRDALRARR
ncbi:MULTISPECIES: endonuclease domain-containing protein [Bacteria]